MNERIRELKEQATRTAMWIGDPDAGELDAEKFAELIVQEMCSVLDKAQWDKGEDWICADGTRIIPHIKEHFGVAE
jgi:hypothetical protein